jgi:hypothetical protein
MELRVEYAANVRKHLGYFPVWQPGDSIVPGDIGELNHGIFIRQTSIADFFKFEAGHR